MVVVIYIIVSLVLSVVPMIGKRPSACLLCSTINFFSNLYTFMIFCIIWLQLKSKIISANITISAIQNNVDIWQISMYLPNGVMADITPSSQRPCVEILQNRIPQTDYAIDHELVWPIDILNKDCKRSISAILTWVPENIKISARPLNSIGN